MNDQITRESLKKLIAMGKEVKALEKMIELANEQSPDIQKLVTLQSNRYQKLKRKRLAGTIDQASANVMASQISSDLIEILDTFRFPGDGEAPLEKDVPKEKEGKKKFLPKPKALSSLGGFLIISGLLLVLSALLYKTDVFDRKGIDSGEKVSPITKNEKEPEGVQTIVRWEDWLGDWETSFETENKQELKGRLVFSKEHGRFEVEGDDNGNVSFGMTLRRIEFDPSKQVMNGIWEIDEEVTGASPGTFNFRLDNSKKSFVGSYTMGENKTEKFSWKGNKIDN